MTALMVCIRFSASSKTMDCRPLEDLVGHLHAIDAELVVNLTANGGVQVVEGWEAVEEHGTGFRPFPVSSFVTR